MSKFRKIAVVIVAILALVCLQLSVVGCKKKGENAFFSDETAQTFTFDGDKTLDADLTFDRAVAFEMEAYTFDLNGYTLTIESEDSGCLVAFKDGTIKNGTLVVSVPNGDVELEQFLPARDSTSHRPGMGRT